MKQEDLERFVGVSLSNLDYSHLKLSSLLGEESIRESAMREIQSYSNYVDRMLADLKVGNTEFVKEELVKLQSNLHDIMPNKKLRLVK